MSTEQTFQILKQMISSIYEAHRANDAARLDKVVVNLLTAIGYQLVHLSDVPRILQEIFPTSGNNEDLDAYMRTVNTLNKIASGQVSMPSVAAATAPARAPAAAAAAPAQAARAAEAEIHGIHAGVHPNTVKRQLLSKKLEKINAQIYGEMTRSADDPNPNSKYNKLVNKRYKCMATFMQIPSKCKTSEFVKKCTNDTEVMTAEPWSQAIADSEIQPIGFVREEDANRAPLKIHCLNKASMVQGMVNPMFYFRDVSQPVYRLSYPLTDVWISNEALITLLLSNSIVFKLKNIGRHALGTFVGVSRIHGNEELIYSIEETDIDL